MGDEYLMDPQNDVDRLARRMDELVVRIRARDTDAADVRRLSAAYMQLVPQFREAYFKKHGKLP